MKYIYKIFSIVIALIFSTSSFATYYAFCDNSGRGFANSDLTQKFSDKNRQAKADEICKLPSAVEHGYDAYKSTQRCLNDMKDKCELGGPGGEGVTDPVDSPHDVPNAAWFSVSAVESDLIIGGVRYNKVRCQCGCFIKETKILTTKGYVPISELLERSKDEFIRLNSSSLDNEFTVSDFLLPKNFTVGPEEKPILGIYLENGSYIAVTDGHPMVVFTNDKIDMVQAKALKIGDSLITEEGVPTKVVNIKSFQIPSTDNVYNIDVGLENWDQKIIVANGIKTGDIKWQNLLSSREQRIKLLSDLTK